MSATTYRTPRYRARVAPRKSGSRTSGSRIQWDRVGRIALVLVLFAVIAAYVGPTIRVVERLGQAGVAEQRLAELKQENARLLRRAEEMKTPAAAIREARKLGLVAEGEQAYVIKGLG